jgi:hypothetical protein
MGEAAVTSTSARRKSPPGTLRVEIRMASGPRAAFTAASAEAESGARNVCTGWLMRFT